MRNNVVGAVVASTLALGAFAGPASADPVEAKSAITFPMVCNNGQTYQVVINGHAAFIPAHVVGSNEVFVPVAYGSITSTAVPSGTPLFSAPPRTKGESASSTNDLTTCSFDVVFPMTPAEVERFGLPSGTTGIRNVGTVTGFITPQSN